MRSFMICTPHQYCAGDKIERNNTGRACSTDGGGESHVEGLVGKPEGKRPLGRQQNTCQIPDRGKKLFSKMSRPVLGPN
jgi:hypothetical protein